MAMIATAVGACYDRFGERSSRIAWGKQNGQRARRVANLQQLQGTDPVRSDLPDLHRIHLQPETHTTRLLQHRLLGRAPTVSESPQRFCRGDAGPDSVVAPRFASASERYCTLIAHQPPFPDRSILWMFDCRDMTEA
jgi:hypothetical protein